MPELPEVESTRLSFANRIKGAHIESLEMGKPLRWPLGIAPQVLAGREVLGVRRRGKYLLLELSEGILLIHLGMSGSLGFVIKPPAAGKHDHFSLYTDKGCLRLNDPRRFGAVVYVHSESDPIAQKLLGALGVEPLEAGFEVESFYLALQKRSAPIKQVLLAGDIVVGVGNIYACEALFHAGIRPTTRAKRLGKSRVARLHDAIRKVLLQALHSGGSTLRNYSNANGEIGHFQEEVMVYGRAGEPCRQCFTPIKVIRQGQRSTFFCPHCEKP